jgi:transcriptional regulator with XRE-family HTH domain
MEVKEKIESIMKNENLNSAQFAAEIGIQGSTLSHIINGRNNPSLDVLVKILNRFRTISSDWLILGVGSMSRGEKQSQTLTLFDDLNENASKSDISDNKTNEKTVSTSSSIQQKSKDASVETIQTFPEAHNNYIPIIETTIKSVHKIIVYYTDNTFQEFETK